jgi:ABC-type branched-subunit amino acid transport system ATPase component
VENVQMALLSADRQLWSFWRKAADHRGTTRWRCWNKWACNPRPIGPCGVLAYGDVKRVELAMAIASNPQLLLMDHRRRYGPSERHELMALTRSWSRRGMAVLFTEHSMDV